MFELILEGDGSKKLTFEVQKIINAGRSARDKDTLLKHVEEIRKAGIAIPERFKFPVFRPKTADRITTSGRFGVLPDSKTSGEVEYVLLFANSNIYVAVGSDHGDRELEKYNIRMSKQIYCNAMSPAIWRYEDVTEHWDDIIMRAWVKKDGQRRLYQEDKLEKLIRPEKLIEEVKTHIIGDLDGLVIFSGTLPTISGELCYSPYFEMELVDEHAGRAIRHAYTAEPISWFKK